MSLSSLNYHTSAHSHPNRYFENYPQKTETAKTLKVRHFSQLDVREKASAIIIENCHLLKVLFKDNKQIVVADFTGLPRITDLSKLKVYVNEAYFELKQLSDGSYKVIIKIGGEGGGQEQSMVRLESGIDAPPLFFGY